MKPLITPPLAETCTNFFLFVTKHQWTPLHTHSHIEIAYILSGKCENLLNGETDILTEGDYILLDKTSHHTYQAVGDEKLTVINCLFYPNFIDGTLSDDADIYTVLESNLFRLSKNLFTENPIGKVFKDTNGEIKKLLSIMNDELNTKNAGYFELIRGCLIQLIITTMRSIYKDVKISTNDDVIQNILEYINLHYMTNLSLSDICEKYNYSLTHLSVKFKNKTGMTFTEYLQKTRIENSMKLLTYSNQSITNIADAVGYTDLQSFYRIFKRYTNTTPAQFKKAQKKFDQNRCHFLYRKRIEF